jgi:hypothetical protein
MTPEDKEILRHEVLNELVARHPVPVSTKGLLSAMRYTMPGKVTLEDVASACALLQSGGLVDCIPDDAGATSWWRATAAGVLRVERGLGEKS